MLACGLPFVAPWHCSISCKHSSEPAPCTHLGPRATALHTTCPGASVCRAKPKPRLLPTRHKTLGHLPSDHQTCAPIRKILASVSEMEEDNSDTNSSSQGEESEEETVLAIKEVELRAAVEEGDVKSLIDGLKALALECGENEARNLKQTIFWAAAERGKTECLSAMLESSGRYLTVNEANEQGDTSLILAAGGDHVTTLHFLLSAGANIFHRNLQQSSALDIACERGLSRSTRVLLSHALDCRARNVFGGAGFRKYLYTGLTTATEFEHVEVVKAFLDAGVEVNMNLNLDTGTPLHCAIEANNAALVDVFITAKADIEALRRSHLQSPLMLAAQLGHVTITQRLLVAGADVNRQTEECSSALTLACHFGHSDVVKELIDHGADVNQKNRWGFNPLFMGTDTPDILDLLLKGGANPDTPCGERDERPLHLASVVGSQEAVERLLLAGADINIRTNENENALWLAVWKGHENISKLLIQQNIELNVPSNACQVYHWDYLPVEVAIGQGRFDIMRMLLQGGCSTRNVLYYTADQAGPVAEIPWLRLRPEPLALLTSPTGQLDFVREYLTNPRSLKHLCRLYIRSKLGRCSRKKVEMLEIPHDLLGYLLLEDL